MKKLLLPFCLLLLCKAYTQYKKPFFNRLTVETGLPEGQVECSLQDKLGYMWLGTQNGLVRYDGYNIKVYPLLDNDGRPIIGPTTTYLMQDNDGTVWAGVLDNGVYYYNRQKDAFVKANIDEAQGFTLKQDEPQTMVDGKKKGTYWLIGEDKNKHILHIDLYDTIRKTVEQFYGGADKNHNFNLTSFSLVTDMQGNIWASGDSLLCMYDDKTGLFKQALVLPDKNRWFGDIYRDGLDSNILWITTYTHGNPFTTITDSSLVKYNIHTHAYKMYTNNIADTTTIAGAVSLCYSDNDHNVWCLCKNKLSLYNRQTDNFTNYAVGSVPGLPQIPDIEYIAEDSRHNFWLSGNFYGMLLFQRNTGLFTYYRFGNNDANGDIPARQATAMFNDHTGSVWTAFLRRGTATLNESRSFFNIIKPEPYSKSSISKPDATSLYYFGAYNDSAVIVGINNLLHTDFYIWNHVSNTYSKLNINLPESDVTHCIFKDREGCIWVSSEAQLTCYNIAANKTKVYKYNLLDSVGSPSACAIDIIEGNDGTIWLGTWHYGICSFNKQTARFTRYPYTDDELEINTNALFNSEVEALCFDKNGVLWIGTNTGGVTAFNPHTGKFKNLCNQKDGLDCVPAIYQDKKGRLWVGTYRSGLFLINTSNFTYKRYSEQDGLAYNGVNNITEDNAGNIWVTSVRGMSLLNPTTGKAIIYNAANALPTNGTGHIFRSSTGVLTVAMANGIMYFNPDAMPKNNIPPFVNIESVKYHATASNSDTILYTYGSGDIPFNYNENKITFNYIALHFANPALNQYAYKLDGYDKEWVSGGTQRSVTYLNLAPGHYTFYVKAANSDGMWNNTGASIAFTINPPWWQTWWAYTLYALALGAAIWGFVYYHNKQLLRRNKVLEYKIKVRTAEVIEQKEEITAQRDNLEQTLVDLKATQTQLVQREKMASLGELTAGIAHEIQNPLNFVNNFSEVNREMLEELKAERLKPDGERDGQLEDELLNDVIDNEQKINHHGKRADAIVKGMLQHSRASTGQKEPININALADEYLRLSYQGLRAKEKNFTAAMHTSFDDSIGKINLVAQDVGRVLLNLYNNAFYAVNEKAKTVGAEYNPTVSVSTQKHGNKVLITVADNGQGIPENIKQKIFQPFFTTKPTGQGTGLGLSLSYDIIKAHGGEIEVESIAGEGAKFTIKLPII